MRYFIGPTPVDISLALEINAVIFGDISKQRTSVNGSKVIVMIPDGDDSTHECLSEFKELTEKEAQEEMQKEEWKEVQPWEKSTI